MNGNWSYTYDDFARLSSAVQSGGQTFNYSYDQQANRWGTISGSNQFTFNDTTNHISNAGVTYDSAGNVTYDGFHSYSYDAEGRLKQVDSGNTAIYNYDSFGHRSMQYAPPVYNEYVVDLTGRAITAVAPGTSTVYTAEVFAGGRHWVTDNGSALFLGADWVGTSRALTNLSGTFDQLYTSLPWGDSLSFAGNGSSFHTTSQYTGKEYDPEANLYHFPARQYAPVQGRWLTPDPAGMAAVDLTNPQTWNRYAYVTNNPVSMTAPNGLDPGDDGGGGMSGGPAGVWSPTSAGGPCFMCGLNNAALWGLQPMKYTLANLEAQSEAGFLGSGGIPWYSVQGGNLMLRAGYTFVPGVTTCPKGQDCSANFGTFVPNLVNLGPVGSSSGSSWWNGSGLAGILYPGMSGQFQAQKNAAQWFGQQAPKIQQVVTDVRTFADNTPLDWGSFMSEETKQYKELLDTAAEGLGQAADFVESNLPELETDITLIIP